MHVHLIQRYLDMYAQVCASVIHRQFGLPAILYMHKQVDLSDDVKIVVSEAY